jgi:hypothetical protein
MKKNEEKSRFAHLAKQAESFKAGKSSLKVTKVDPRTLEAAISYESYEEMRKRHQSKGKAALEFKKLRQDLKLTQAKMAMALRGPWKGGKPGAFLSIHPPSCWLALCLPIRKSGKN